MTDYDKSSFLTMYIHSRYPQWMFEQYVKGELGEEFGESVSNTLGFQLYALRMQAEKLKYETVKSIKDKIPQL